MRVETCPRKILMSHFREEREGFRHIVIQKGKVVIREKAKIEFWRVKKF